MANKRMFSKSITNSDDFLELPDSSQVLYFHLNMNADDDGFVNNWKSIMRMTGTKEDDMKILITKNYIIPFETGIIVIRHWRINNYLRNDRYVPTKYQEEYSLLDNTENKEYQLKQGLDINGIPTVSPDKNSIDKNNIYNIYGQNDLEKSNNDQYYLIQFDQFYENYPRKVKKQDVKKWFIKNKPSEQLFNDIMKCLDLFKKDNDWLKDNGQYIPYPTSWLNQKRWEEKLDMLKEIENKQNKKLQAVLGFENLTKEEYLQLMNGEITQQELIERGRLYVQ